MRTLTDAEEKALDEILEFINNLPAPDVTALNNNACVEACKSAHDTCMANAGSTLEKAACNTRYRNCLVEC